MHSIQGPTLDFVKMQGSGNDFVVIDNRARHVQQADMAHWAKAVCRRAFGVYADGIFFLENPPAGRDDVDFVWHFYNADGSRAEMCGNGSRCAARLAHELGMAPKKLAIGTDAGVVRAEVLDPGDRVRVLLTPPKNVRTGIALNIGGHDLTAHLADTGVPHVVVFVDDANGVDVQTVGRAVRTHAEFAPAGANANFAQLTGTDTFALRTYERGVEAETYACGTGAAATVYLAHKLGLCGPKADLVTSGGETLTIDVDGEDVYLAGGAEITFVGQMNLKALGLE